MRQVCIVIDQDVARQIWLYPRFYGGLSDWKSRQ